MSTNVFSRVMDSYLMAAIITVAIAMAWVHLVKAWHRDGKATAQLLIPSMSGGILAGLIGAGLYALFDARFNVEYAAMVTYVVFLVSSLGIASCRVTRKKMMY